MREGDKLTVLVEDIDAQGKISLRPVGAEWDVPEGSGEAVTVVSGVSHASLASPRAPGTAIAAPRRHGRRFRDDAGEGLPS